MYLEAPDNFYGTIYVPVLNFKGHHVWILESKHVFSYLVLHLLTWWPHSHVRDPVKFTTKFSIVSFVLLQCIFLR